MGKEEQIRQSLLKYTKPGTATILGKVADVDEAEKTITLVDDETGVEFFDVRLKPVIDSDEFVTIIPKVDSWCLAVRIEDDEDWVVLMVQQAEKITSKIGTTELVQTEGGFEIKKGEDDLKTIITLLIEAVTQIVVLQGSNPNYVKLQQSLLKVNNLFI